VCDGNNALARPLPFKHVMIPKSSNSVGLQLADLMARPVGRARPFFGGKRLNPTFAMDGTPRREATGNAGSILGDGPGNFGAMGILEI
jgi:hypothetical protein